MIGGTRLFGGVGTIFGTVVGLFIPAILQNGFVITGVQPFWQQVAVGAVLIVAGLHRPASPRRGLRGTAGKRPARSVPGHGAREAHHLDRSDRPDTEKQTMKTIEAHDRLSRLSSAAGVARACGSSEAAPAAAAEAITFIQGVAGDEFYITMQCGIEAEAKKLGATVDTQGPTKFDPTLQKPIVDSVVASKPDAILIAPTDVSAMQAPLEAAAAQDIKVVLVDTTVEDPSFAVSQIASDNEGGGRRRSTPSRT